MGNLRGLRTRLYPKCNAYTPHRTLYVKTRADSKPRWFQTFWACERCGSLNHIILHAYRLDRASFPLPSALAVGVVNALREGGELDSDELIMSLRRRRILGVGHVFNSEVGLVLEFLTSRGVVAESTKDRTEKVMDLLRAKPADSYRMGACPAESNHSSTKGVLVSLYAQRQTGPARATRLVPCGVFCPQCQFYSMGTGSRPRPG